MIRDLTVRQVDLPAHWTSYLIYGDVSELVDFYKESLAEVEAVLKAAGVSEAGCVDVSKPFDRVWRNGKLTELATFSFLLRSKDTGCDDVGEYYGWANYETWNVSLWIVNDEGLYSIAKQCRKYKNFVAAMRELESSETPDGVAWNDSGLDIEALDRVIEETKG